MNTLRVSDGIGFSNLSQSQMFDAFSVAEYEDMTGDELQIHLFVESADSQNAKMATELLETENPTMQRLQVKSKGYGE